MYICIYTYIHICIYAYLRSTSGEQLSQEHIPLVTSSGWINLFPTAWECNKTRAMIDVVIHEVCASNNFIIFKLDTAIYIYFRFETQTFLPRPFSLFITPLPLSLFLHIYIYIYIFIYNSLSPLASTRWGEIVVHRLQTLCLSPKQVCHYKRIRRI